MKASAFCGGYTKQFAVAVIAALEKQFEQQEAHDTMLVEEPKRQRTGMRPPKISGDRRLMICQ